MPPIACARWRVSDKEEDLRGAEWHYLRRFATRFQAGRIADARSRLLDLAISPDGRSLAGASGDGALSVWDTATGALRLQVSDARAASLAYTADGEVVISARAMQAPEKGSRAAIVGVRAWDVSTGKEIVKRKFTVDVGEVGQHALTADGSALIAFTSDAKRRLWDLEKGGEIATLDALAADSSIERAMMHVMALAPDRKALVWQMGPTTMVWDLETKKLRVKHFQSRHWTFAVAFSPDGKLVACHRGGPPHVVQLWDWAAGRQLAELQGFAGHVYAMTFSPDGKLRATGDEFGTIRLMEAATGKEAAALKGHGGMITALVFARDGQWLYSAGQHGFVRRWRPIPDPNPDRIDGDVALFPVTCGVSPDGRSFFTYSGSKRGYDRWEVIHRDLASNRELARFQASGRTVLSRDGRRVAFQNPDERSLRIWDVFSNRELASVESPGWHVGRKGFSPDGRILALTDPDQIKLYDSDTGKYVAALAVAKASAIAFSPDGRFFVASGTRTGEADPTVTLWRTAPLKELATLPGTASALTFSPDSQTLAVIQSDKVVLWDINPQVVHATLKPPQPGSAYAYGTRPPHGFSPDGKLFAIADNMHIRLWNTVTGELLGPLAGPRESTRDLAWSAHGKTRATSSGSKLKLWNVATRQELNTFVGTNGAYCHAFAPDGSLLVVDSMNTIRLWRTGLDQNAR